MGCRSFISIILSGYLFVECGVFAQNFEIFGQRGDRVDRLPVTGVVRKGYVHVEAVLPFAADNGHRLDFGEVDVVERKYDEELRENGVDKILKYGIACYMKRCKVKLAEESYIET